MLVLRESFAPLDAPTREFTSVRNLLLKIKSLFHPLFEIFEWIRGLVQSWQEKSNTRKGVKSKEMRFEVDVKSIRLLGPCLFQLCFFFLRRSTSC